MTTKLNISHYIKITLISIILSSCTNNSYIPKKYEYFRINLPEAKYQECNVLDKCSFQISKYAIVTKCDDTWANKSDEWFNLQYPLFNADIHISYKKISKDNFYNISEESRELAYKHTVRASNINESLYANDTTNVYGILYEMGGASASQAQFFMTDSASHFLRGSLYFNNIPNYDSIAPVNQFILQDLIRLIETIRWE